MERAPRDNGSRSMLPTLPLPGALAASGILILLCLLGTRALWLALPFALFAAVILAALLLLHRTWVPFAAALAAAVPAVCFAADIPCAAVMLLFLPLGVSAAFAVQRSMPRIPAAVVSATVSALTAAVALAFFLLLTGRTPGAWLSELAEVLLARLLSLRVETVDQGMLPLFTESAAQALLHYVSLLLPSVVPLFFFYGAAAVQAMLYSLIHRLGAAEDFFPQGFQIRVGRIPAVLYSASQLAVLLAITTPGAETGYYAAYNASLVLMAPLVLSGFSALRRRLRGRDLGTMSRITVLVLVFMLLAVGLYWLGVAAAMYGVFLAFRQPGGADREDN